MEEYTDTIETEVTEAEEQSTLPGLMMQEPLLLIIGVLAFVAIALGGLCGYFYKQVQTLKSPGCPACPVCPACPAHQYPPSIILAEGDRDFRFPIGSAELLPDFQRALSQRIVPQILGAIQRYGVNLVRVIGHTDQVPVGSRGNLDKTLIPHLTGQGGDRMVAGSNADLGLLRAISVVLQLQADSRLQGISLVPLSGGQVVLPGNQIASDSTGGDEPDRRRVELALTRQ